MAVALRVIGGLLMAYAALYVAQFIFNTLYDNPQQVWDVMNYVSALAILVALAANFAYMRSQSGGGEPLNLARLGAHTLFYANAVLAIWYFRNWIYLLALDEGESANVPVDVIWDLVAAMIPLVLAHHRAQALAEGRLERVQRLGLDAVDVREAGLPVALAPVSGEDDERRRRADPVAPRGGPPHVLGQVQPHHLRVAPLGAPPKPSTLLLLIRQIVQLSE